MRAVRSQLDLNSVELKKISENSSSINRLKFAHAETYQRSLSTVKSQADIRQEPSIRNNREETAEESRPAPSFRALRSTSNESNRSAYTPINHRRFFHGKRLESVPRDSIVAQLLAKGERQCATYGKDRKLRLHRQDTGKKLRSLGTPAAYRTHEPPQTSVHNRDSRSPNENPDLEVRTVDNKRACALELPDDSNYNRMVSFIEGLKQSIDVKKRKVETTTSPGRRPKVVLQNFVLGKGQATMCQSRSVRSLPRATIQKSVDQRKMHGGGTPGAVPNRCETPNTVPSAGATQRQPVPGTDPASKRSLSFSKIRSRLGSLILHHVAQYSSDASETLFQAPLQPTHERTASTEERKSSSPVSAAGSRSPLSSRLRRMAREIGLKAKHHVSPEGDAARATATTSAVRPSRPLEVQKSEQAQKFRQARRLHHAAKERNKKAKEEAHTERRRNVSPQDLRLTPGDIAGMRDCLHVQPEESLVLFPTLRTGTPFFTMRATVKDVMYADPLSIDFPLNSS